MSNGRMVTRQWEILKQIKSCRGVTAQELAIALDVTPRTIRRDLDVLQSVGFPLYDENVEEAGGYKKMWKLNGTIL